MLIRHLWALLTMKPPERHQRPYRQIEAAPALGMELLGEQHQIDDRARHFPAGTGWGAVEARQRRIRTPGGRLALERFEHLLHYALRPIRRRHALLLHPLDGI